jgi:predicted RNA-binding protein (virulence factor B family)
VRVSNIKEDGKLDLSLKDAPRLQIDKDGEKILKVLIRNKGSLPLNDDSSPEEVNKILGMSKSSFKKASGRLMKRRLIIMTKNGIEMLSDDEKQQSKVKKSNIRYKKK